MALQKGLNSNRNHHDSLSQSGMGRTGSDVHVSGNNYGGPVHSGNDRPYGQGKHSNGGKPKQYHY